MSNNIVEIDLSKLDADIAELQKQIELLMSTRKYAQSIAVKANPVASTKEVSPAVNTPKRTTASAPQSKKKSKLGVTDFILKFLKSNDRVDGKAIIKAYAVYLEKTEKQITPNIANALSRLKSAKKVNNEAKPDGKQGSLWFLTKRL